MHATATDGGGVSRSFLGLVIALTSLGFGAW
jgi:hypothetical protein